MNAVRGSAGVAGGSIRARNRNVLVGRCAGILFLAAALVSVPTNLLLPGVQSGWSPYFGPAVSFCLGVACLVAPWRHMDERWLHFIPPVAVLEIVVSVESLGHLGDVYLWHLVITSIWVGYAFRRPGALILHMTFMGAAVLATPWMGPYAGAGEIVQTAVAVPVLVGSAGVVAWLRAGLEARERQHEHEARTDALTGLSNRRVLMEDLDEATAPNAWPSTLVLFDLDGFKEYNDRFGHPAGDALLERLAHRLDRAVGTRGHTYRLGGDEFCVLLGLPERASRGALRDCLSALSESGDGYAIAASHGVAELPREAGGPSSALTSADSRMYDVKLRRRAEAELLAGSADRRHGSRRVGPDIVADLRVASASSPGPPRPASSPASHPPA